MLIFMSCEKSATRIISKTDAVMKRRLSCFVNGTLNSTFIFKYLHYFYFKFFKLYML